MNKLQSSITDRMQFTIVNGRTDDTEPIAVVIAHGNIDTEGFELEEHNGVVTGVNKHHHNNAGLIAAGYAADVVLDDAEVLIDGGTASVKMFTSQGKSIDHCLRYLSNNFRSVKRVTVAAMINGSSLPKPDAYNASMLFASLNPFQKEAAREVDMSQYFQTNQFQSGKIVMDYNYGDLQWNDTLYWAIQVAGATTLKVTIDFYPQVDNA